jgi:hypothetical protein
VPRLDKDDREYIHFREEGDSGREDNEPSFSDGESAIAGLEGRQGLQAIEEEEAPGKRRKKAGAGRPRPGRPRRGNGL